MSSAMDFRFGQMAGMLALIASKGRFVFNQCATAAKKDLLAALAQSDPAVAAKHLTEAKFAEYIDDNGLRIVCRFAGEAAAAYKAGDETKFVTALAAFSVAAETMVTASR